jgi:hypothetical protein
MIACDRLTERAHCIHVTKRKGKVSHSLSGIYETLRHRYDLCPISSEIESVKRHLY